MSNFDENLSRFCSSIYKVDTGPYYFILAFWIEKQKNALIAINKNRNMVFERAPFNPNWKRETLNKEQALELLMTANFIENRIPKEGIEITQELINETEKEKPLPETLAVMVGNIVDEREFGEDHHIVHGTKQFSPGTKVYCRPVSFGIEERWKITGIPKHGGKYITVILSPDCVTNLRAKIVYSPKLIDKLIRDYVYFDSKEQVENWIKIVNEWRESKNLL